MRTAHQIHANQQLNNASLQSNLIKNIGLSTFSEANQCVLVKSFALSCRISK